MKLFERLKRRQSNLTSSVNPVQYHGPPRPVRMNDLYGLIGNYWGDPVICQIRIQSLSMSAPSFPWRHFRSSTRTAPPCALQANPIEPEIRTTNKVSAAVSFVPSVIRSLSSQLYVSLFPVSSLFLPYCMNGKEIF
jgi:hypothetical protein